MTPDVQRVEGTCKGKGLRAPIPARNNLRTIAQPVEAIPTTRSMVRARSVFSKSRTRKRFVRAVFSVGRFCCIEQGGACAPRALDFAIAMRTQQVAKLVQLDVACAQ